VTDFDSDFARLVADERAATAAQRRARERNLRAAALTDATLAGVLLDLAERGERVTIRTAFGRSITGHITLVAQDGLVLEGPLGTSYLRFDGIATVRCRDARLPAEPSGDRCPPRAASLAALLAELALERPRVAVAVAGEGSVVNGELRAVGADVVTVNVADAPIYLATRHVSELTVLASG